MNFLIQRNPFGAPLRSALPYTDSPWRLAITDLTLLITSSPMIIWILWPYFTNNPYCELYLWNWRNIASISWQFFLVFYAFAVFMVFGYILSIGAIAFIPPQGLILAVIGTIIGVIAWLLIKQPLTYISVAGVEAPGESWLYVNGICCSRWWLKLNCEMLADMFGRRVVGIYNRTFGPVFDLLECIIQRDFGYTTDDVRQLYAIIKTEIQKKSNTKVVLIAHSQVRLKLYSSVHHLNGA